MKAVVAAFNQEKALVGAFSVITNLRMELFQALISTVYLPSTHYLSTYLQVDFYSDRYVGTNLDNPSFAEISRAMGGEGVTVTRPEEVGPD